MIPITSQPSRLARFSFHAPSLVVVRVDEEGNDQRDKPAGESARNERRHPRTGRVPMAPALCDVLILQ